MKMLLYTYAHNIIFIFIIAWRGHPILPNKVYIMLKKILTMLSGVYVIFADRHLSYHHPKSNL